MPFKFWMMIFNEVLKHKLRWEDEEQFGEKWFFFFYKLNFLKTITGGFSWKGPTQNNYKDTVSEVEIDSWNQYEPT